MIKSCASFSATERMREIRLKSQLRLAPMLTLLLTLIHRPKTRRWICATIGQPSGISGALWNPRQCLSDRKRRQQVLLTRNGQLKCEAKTRNFMIPCHLSSPMILKSSAFVKSILLATSFLNREIKDNAKKVSKSKVTTPLVLS